MHLDIGSDPSLEFSNKGYNKTFVQADFQSCSSVAPHQYPFGKADTQTDLLQSPESDFQDAHNTVVQSGPANALLLVSSWDVLKEVFTTGTKYRMEGVFAFFLKRIYPFILHCDCKLGPSKRGAF